MDLLSYEILQSSNEVMAREPAKKQAFVQKSRCSNTQQTLKKNNFFFYIAVHTAGAASKVQAFKWEH